MSDLIPLIIEKIKTDDFVLKADFFDKLLSGDYQLIEKPGYCFAYGVARNCRVYAQDLKNTQDKKLHRAFRFYTEGAERLERSTEENLRWFQVETNEKSLYWLYVGYDSLDILCCMEMLDNRRS